MSKIWESQTNGRLSPPAIKIGLIVVFLVVVVSAYSLRYRIEATVWHWHNSGVLQLKPYTIPIPMGWFVETEDPSSATALKLRPLFDREQEIYPTIGFSSISAGKRDLALWKSAKMSRFPKEGLLQEQFQLDGEQLTCIGGNWSRKAIEIECLSNGSLNVTFMGTNSDVEEFYSILKGISKGK
jgi:hypothetical protein